MTIIKAGTEDIYTIKNLAELIWPEAYGDILSPAQLHYMLGLIYSETALRSQFEKGHSFVIALHDQTPIGFGSFSKKSDAEPATFRLHKLYVLPRQHAQGVGTALLNYVIEKSRDSSATLLELNVNKHNIAKQFYEKKGFTVLRDEVIDIGSGYMMDDYVMVREI